MSISKDKILKSYIDYPFISEIFTKEALENEILLLSKNSQKLVLKPKKEDNDFLSVFVHQSDPSEKKTWRTNNQYKSNTPQNTAKTFEFARGQNFHPKEEVIPLKIENIFNFNEKFNFPKDIPSFYIRNTVNKVFFGPLSSNDLINLYSNNKIDSTFEIKPIDIYSIKDQSYFAYLSIKEINNDNWADIIEDSALLKYTDLNKKFVSLSQENQNLPEKTNELDNSQKEEKKDISQDVKQNPKNNNNDLDVWEDPNKKKKKLKSQKVQPNVVGMSNNKDDKINKVNTIYKKEEKKEGLVSGEELVNMLKPKKAPNTKEVKEEEDDEKEENKDDDGNKNTAISGNRKKNKKKKRPTNADNINLGFEY